MLLQRSEALFDLDYPDHYMRRIKSVSVTILCVAGLYTDVNSILSLLSSSLCQSNTLLSGKYARQAHYPLFSDRSGIVESIVTSSGQGDSGLFETNLRDERYLPPLYPLFGDIPMIRDGSFTQCDLALFSEKESMWKSGH